MYNVWFSFKLFLLTKLQLGVVAYFKIRFLSSLAASGDAVVLLQTWHGKAWLLI